MTKLTRCDEAGVPRVVQSITPQIAGWSVELFTGQWLYVDFNELPPDLSCYETSIKNVETYINNKVTETA